MKAKGARKQPKRYRIPRHIAHAINQGRAGRLGNTNPEKNIDYIEHFPAIFKDNPDIPVIPVTRVSSEDQRRNGSLKDSADKLQESLSRKRVNMIHDVITEVRKGYEWDRSGPLGKARKLAIDHGAIIVATSTDRLIRSKRFHPCRNFDCGLTIGELEEMKCFFIRSRWRR